MKLTGAILSITENNISFTDFVRSKEITYQIRNICFTLMNKNEKQYPGVQFVLSQWIYKYIIRLIIILRDQYPTGEIPRNRFNYEFSVRDRFFPPFSFKNRAEKIVNEICWLDETDFFAIFVERLGISGGLKMQTVNSREFRDWKRVTIFQTLFMKQQSVSAVRVYPLQCTELVRVHDSANDGSIFGKGAMSGRLNQPFENAHGIREILALNLCCQATVKLRSHSIIKKLENFVATKGTFIGIELTVPPRRLDSKLHFIVTTCFWINFKIP